MRSFKEIKKHYDITEAHETRLNSISGIIGVALVAFIRETRIITLKHKAVEPDYYYIALILGMVFWLVTKAEERSS